MISRKVNRKKKLIANWWAVGGRRGYDFHSRDITFLFQSYFDIFHGILFHQSHYFLTSVTLENLTVYIKEDIGYGALSIRHYLSCMSSSRPSLLPSTVMPVTIHQCSTINTLSLPTISLSLSLFWVFFCFCLFFTFENDNPIIL